MSMGDMKLTNASVVDVVRQYMTDANALCYVPIQKFTIAMAMLVVARLCGKCGVKDCTDCTVLTLSKKLKKSISYEPMFDENFNVLEVPRRNCDRFGGDIDKLREACARERGLNPEEDFPDVFPDWLLAPSTAKESGVRK